MSSARRAYDLLRGYIAHEWERIQGVEEDFAEAELNEAIETAKQNGNWDNAYSAQSIATLPEDFAAELLQNTKAKSFYDSLNSQNKYAIIFRLQHAKKPETRLRLIARFLEMLEKGEKIYS